MMIIITVYYIDELTMKSSRIKEFILDQGVFCLISGIEWALQAIELRNREIFKDMVNEFHVMPEVSTKEYY